MKLLATLTLALACLCAPMAAVGQVRAVATSDGIDAVAVGDNGAIYRTLDGGFNWQDLSLGGTMDLRGIGWRQMTMVYVGTGGTIGRSTTGGGGWVTTIEPGGHDLNDVVLVNPTAAYIVGDGGTILKSVDDGATWTPQTSGTSAHLHAVEFTDASNGWAAGDGGTLLRTTNGGAVWTPVALGSTVDLLDVDQGGTRVWAVGRDGAAFRSSDGGGVFAPINLKLDTGSDVNVVHMQGPDTLWIAGGGGFIRYSTNGGTTWTFQQHRMHHPISSMASIGAKVFAGSSGNNKVVMWSSDRGAFWRFPNGPTITRSWSGPKLSAVMQVRGNTLNYHKASKRFYAAIGNRIYKSYNLGDTWSQVDTMPPAYTKCNAFIVSPKDTNLMIAAVAANTGGAPDRIIRSTNGGADWTIVLTHDFGEYGIPLEMHPDKPDTLYFGGEFPNSTPLDAIYRSLDFGATWTAYSNSVFRSPCDIVAIPDTNLVLVGDGITGSGVAQFFRSTNGGQSFTSTLAASSSEIPTIANSRLRPATSLATNWQTGGVYRTNDYGVTWAKVDLTTDPWGIDIARDDPNVILFGQYVGSFSFISVDGGGMWTSFAVPGSFGNNYSLYARDRGLILAEQSSGIWKLAVDYIYTPLTPTQTLTLNVPNGGEVWSPGQVRSINWSASWIPTARLEYRRAPGEPWQFIADTPGYLNSYAWTVPADAGTQVKFRISDAWDGSPVDSSNAAFTITGPRLVVTPPALDFGTVGVGSGTGLALTVRNDGTTTLNVTDAVAGGDYVVSRTTLTLPAGQTDTLSVWFQPSSAGPRPDSLRLFSNDAAHSPTVVPLTGNGVGPSITVLTPAGGESWSYGAVEDVTWSSTAVSQVDVAYRVHPDSAWIAVAGPLPAASGSYAWSIPYDPTASAQVRVGQTGGAAQGVSAPFALVSPLLGATPDTLRLPAVILGGTVSDTLHFENLGDATLQVTSIAVAHPEFWTGRSSLTLAPGASDTVHVYYKPLSQGRDTASVTIATNDPLTPHHQAVTGFGATSLAAEPGPPPARFALLQNLPNPFGGSTQIRYALPVAADVTLEVFNLQGQRVATLARGRMEAGQHAVSFGPGSATAGGERLGAMPTGVYFYRLQAGPFFATRKMLLVR